jgi:hypothetical protein
MNLKKLNPYATGIAGVLIGLILGTRTLCDGFVLENDDT